MEVILAEKAGFCFGVKRAVEKVYEQIENKTNRAVYTYGPIIHNEEVVRDLEKKGVRVIESIEELKALKNAVIVIRSHGVSRQIYDIIEKNQLELVDATCPFVKKIHHIVKEESEQGKAIVIIGNPTHPEVQGIKGWSCMDTIVIGTEQEAYDFSMNEKKKLCIVSQTTFNYKKFQKLVEIISKKGYDINVLETICNATHERQKEALQIAREVDTMIVIGGKTSSNTQKLYEICKKECKNTYYIQTLEDLDMCKLQSSSCVGITAGASTPNNIIEEVLTNVRIKF